MAWMPLHPSQTPRYVKVSAGYYFSWDNACRCCLIFQDGLFFVLFYHFDFFRLSFFNFLCYPFSLSILGVHQSILPWPPTAARHQECPTHGEHLYLPCNLTFMCHFGSSCVWSDPVQSMVGAFRLSPRSQTMADY